MMTRQADWIVRSTTWVFSLPPCAPYMEIVVRDATRRLYTARVGWWRDFYQRMRPVSLASSR